MYREKFVRRLPERLEDLHGPASGIVEPPLQVVWSGRRAFDLADERDRMSLYRTVLAEAVREDLCALLDRRTLIHLWPTVRRMIPKAARSAWEEAFEVLRERARTGRPQPPPPLADSGAVGGPAAGTGRGK